MTKTTKTTKHTEQWTKAEQAEADRIADRLIEKRRSERFNTYDWRGEGAPEREQD